MKQRKSASLLLFSIVDHSFLRSHHHIHIAEGSSVVRRDLRSLDRVQRILEVVVEVLGHHTDQARTLVGVDHNLLLEEIVWDIRDHSSLQGEAGVFLEIALDHSLLDCTLWEVEEDLGDRSIHHIDLSGDFSGGRLGHRVVLLGSERVSVASTIEVVHSRLECSGLWLL